MKDDSGSRMIRKARPLLYVLFCGLLLSCQREGTSPSNTLTTVVTAPVNSLNPLLVTDAAGQHINELSHGALVSIDHNLLPKPYLAESFFWKDSQTISFRLKKDCTFVSGRKITSSDIRRSWEYYLRPENAAAFAESMSRIKEVRIKNDWEFDLLLKAPTLSLLADLDLLKILDLDSPLSKEPKAFHIPGAGPFELLSHDATEVKLKRREQPCLARPPLEYISVKVVRDDLSRYLKVKTGEVDVILNELNYRKVEMIQQDPTLPLKVETIDGIGFSYIGINISNEKLRDIRVRKALALSLDIPSLIKFKGRGMANPARNLLADMNFYSNKNIQIVTRDLEKAKKLLDEAGFSNGANGKPPLRLTLKTNTSSISTENARVMIAQAKEAGIEIKHVANEWGIFYNDVKTGNTELYTLRWVGVTDPRIYYEIFHSREMGKGNRTRYSNSKLDSLLDKAEATNHLETRKKLYDQVQAMVADDLPYLNLWHGQNVAVLRKEVQGLQLHPAGKWEPLLGVRKE